jgi:hypothetical protein
LRCQVATTASSASSTFLRAVDCTCTIPRLGRLLGHKFVRDAEKQHNDAPNGWKKVPIFELEREVVVKRRSHYA